MEQAMTPTEVIAKAREIAKARTKGPYEPDLSNAKSGKYATLHEFIDECGFMPTSDARFIVLSDKLIDALLDVAEAAAQDTQHYAEGYCKRIDEALKRLGEVGL